MKCTGCQEDNVNTCFERLTLSERCPCGKTACKYHGLCCECIQAHIQVGKRPPVCLEQVFHWEKKK